MIDNLRDSKLISEEIKATKLFIGIFYLVFLSYDLLYYFIVPRYNERSIGLPEGGLGLVIYLLVGLLLPVTFYVMRKKDPFWIKYIIYFGFNLIDIINNFLIYFGTDLTFRSGNIVEIMFIIFAPLFVDKKFFWIVFTGLVVKYVLFGLAFHDSSVIVAIGMLIIITFVAYILLVRFTSYVKAIRLANESARQKENLVLMGQMATAIGHEIRNPLASLRGFAQLQQENYPNQNEYYPIMIQEIDRIDSIVSDLMMIGKPRVSHFEKHSLEEVIEYVGSIVTQQAMEKGIMMKTEISEKVGYLECDDKQIKQVLINLLKNAIESMDNGGTIRTKSEIVDKNAVLISIKDQGCGISKEELKRIGEPFFTTKDDGNGLGLMISKLLIKDHGGDLSIDSILGEGTEMKIRLPIVQS
ncbi:MULTISPECIES: ATP-binding protein [unclassified Bacillus (in: firmicutes)]|uniref:ATP-binding protein n=1 Tax=unclassified Bacillus (in: firmicutes) TaxID=185979 RepID=UPI00158748F5|nr:MULTISPECIES: ATP-binding protein [unclassified Bacillus (in: firmicutes)]